MRGWGIFARDGHCLEAYETQQEAESVAIGYFMPKITASSVPDVPGMTVFRATYNAEPVYVSRLAFPWNHRYTP